MLVGTIFGVFLQHNAASPVLVRNFLNWALLGTSAFFTVGALAKFRVVRQLVPAGGEDWVQALCALGGLIAAAVAIYRCVNVVAILDRLVFLSLLPLFNLAYIELSRVPLVPNKATEKLIASVVQNAPKPPLTLVLLFDELSPDTFLGPPHPLAGQQEIFREWVAHSEVYTNAYLPGGQTAEAIPSLMLDSGSGQPALSSIFRERSEGVRVLGWYIDYCALLKQSVHGCASVSILNPRTLGGGVSLLNPIVMNTVLLPHKLPFGFLKTPVATWLHEKTFINAQQWVDRTLTDARVEIAFAHFNVPHTPYLSPRLPAAAPQRYQASAERYVQQLTYVAQVLELVRARMLEISHDRPARVVVMADHNLRALTPRELHEHVPLLVRCFQPTAECAGAGQIAKRVHAGKILASRLVQWHGLAKAGTAN